MESAEVIPYGGSKNHEAIIGGHVENELLKRSEYLAAENEILRSKIKGRIKFTNDERRVGYRYAETI